MNEEVFNSFLIMIRKNVSNKEFIKNEINKFIYCLKSLRYGFGANDEIIRQLKILIDLNDKIEEESNNEKLENYIRDLIF